MNGAPTHIGGAAAGEGNVIASNGWAGVAIWDTVTAATVQCSSR